MRRYGDSFTASFTVEASLILPFVLMTMALIIYAGFYLHDRAALDAIAFEAALRGSQVRYERADPERTAEELGRRLLENSTLVCRNVEIKAGGTGDEIEVYCRGEFEIPASLIFIPGFQYSSFTIETRRRATKFCQTDFVRKCRMIENPLADYRRENGD